MKNNLLKLWKGLFLLCICLCAFSTATYAEGSKELVANGGFRPYTEYDSNVSANISRQTKLTVYANYGEKIALASSEYNAFDNQEIIITDPSGRTTSYNVENLGTGHIQSVDMEKAGPNVDGSNTAGYTPYLYSVKQTGLYTVVFHGELSIGGSNNPTATGATYNTGFPSNPNRKQSATVAAWDISVFNESNEYIKGRVYTNYLALNTGGNDTAVKSEVFVLTADGYQYKVNLNGLCPWGFIFYANNRGLVDSTTHTTLYKNAIANPNSADSVFDLLGNISAPRPDTIDAGKNVTHKIFFNKPASDLPIVIPTKPQVSATFNVDSIKTNITNSELSDGATYWSAGFTAKVNFSKVCTYTVVVDVNKDGKYTDGTDATLRDAAAKGVNTIIWDGRDDNGNIVTAEDIQVIIYIKSGEVHFPLIDVENNPNGLKVELVNAEEIVKNNNNYALYYDDSSYVTANGTSMSLETISPTTSLDPGEHSPNGFVDTSVTGAGSYSNKYGDKKIIDFWTYVRGYQNAPEAGDNVYVQSDGVYNYEYYTATLTNTDSGVTYGYLNGYVFYDENSNGTYNEEDIAFPISMPVYVTSNDGNETINQVIYTSVAEGRFIAPVLINDSANSTYEAYVFIPDEYTGTTSDAELVNVKVNANYEIVDDSQEGTVRRALKITGEFSNAGTIYNQYRDIGIGYMENSMPDATVSLATDKAEYIKSSNADNKITYTVTVTNLSASVNIQNVVVSVPILANHIYSEYSAEAGTYRPYIGQWEIDVVPKNTTYTLTITSIVNVMGDYNATANLSAYNEVGGENNNATAQYNVYEALFNFESAKKTNRDNVLVVGDLNNSTDDESVITEYDIYSVGFVGSNDVTELEKSIVDFDINSETVFYSEVTNMYNTVYDTEGYTEDNVPSAAETTVYSQDDSTKYYGATVFEGLLEELNNNAPVYVQGFTRFSQTGQLIREESIYSLTVDDKGEIVANLESVKTISGIE